MGRGPSDTLCSARDAPGVLGVFIVKRGVFLTPLVRKGFGGTHGHGDAIVIPLFCLFTLYIF